VIDTREQNGEYIMGGLGDLGVEADICTLPYTSGCDYLISNTHGSCGIQRKDSMAELAGQMEELRTDILPRLCTFTNNPVLLVEESHQFGEHGFLFRKEGSMLVETGLHSSAYFGFLESTRNMGIDVVTLRAMPDLSPTIHYLAAMDGYLSREHYPKHMKTYKPNQIAMGMLCCVPGIGQKRAEKALKGKSIADIVRAKELDGLTDGQLKKVQRVLQWRS
jgi:ERCC4-type nuclease